MANAGTVNINLRMLTAQFAKDAMGARGAIEGIGKTVSLVKGVMAGFLGVAALRQVVSFTKATMDQIDATAKLADRLGTSTEALTSMTYAGDLAGVSAEGLTKGLQKMEIAIADAKDGAGKTGEALKAMGLDLDSLRSKAPEAQFEAIADGMGKLATSGEQASAAVAIFGKAGAEMLPMMLQGSEAIREQRKEAEQLGLTYSRLDAAKVEQANDSWTRVKAVFQGGLNQAVIALSPYVEGLAKWFTDAVKAAGGFGSIAKAAVEKVAYSIGIMGDAWEVIKMGVAATKVAFLTLTEGVLWLSSKVVSAVIGWGQLFDQFGTLLGNIGRAASRNWAVTWGEMKAGAASAVGWIAQKFADLLQSQAQAAGFYSEELQTQMQTAAFAIQRGVTKMADENRQNLKNLREDAAFTGKALADSFAKLGTVDTKNNPIVKMLDAGKAEAHSAAEEAATQYATAFNNVASKAVSTTIRKAFAEMNAQSTATAQTAAENAQRRIEQQQAAQEHALEWARVYRESTRAGLNQDRLLEDERYAEQVAKLDEYYKGVEGKEAEHQLAMEQLRAGHEARLASISMTNQEKVAQWERKTGQQKLQFAGDVFGNLATLMNTHSRKAFEVGKIAAYAQALVATAAGIARQFADLPIYLAVPAAAAVAIAGAVQIQQIASTSFGGGGNISTGGNGTVPTVNGNPVGNAAAPGVSGAERTSQRIEITGLPDGVVMDGRSVRGLISRILDEVSDGAGGGRVVFA